MSKKPYFSGEKKNVKKPYFSGEKKNVKKPYFLGEKKNVKKPYFSGEKKKCEKTLFFRREKKMWKNPIFQERKKISKTPIKKKFFTAKFIVKKIRKILVVKNREKIFGLWKKNFGHFLVLKKKHVNQKFSLLKY